MSVLLLLVILVLPGFYNVFRYLISNFESVSNVEIIGHRGAAGLAPENTLKAVQAGIANHSKFIEMDVRRSRDGELVILHDRNVDRTMNGVGDVDNLDSDRVLALEQKDPAERYPDTRIPTLAQILDSLKPGNVDLFLEFKSPKDYPGIESQVLQLVSSKGMQNRVVFMSFDFEAMIKFKRANPTLRVGAFCIGIEKTSQFKGLDYVCPAWPILLYRPGYAELIHDLGAKSFVWTVDSPFWIRYSIFAGADGIISDRPDLVSKEIKK